MNERDRTDDARGRSGSQLGMLFVCFAEQKAASRAHRPVEARLRANGDEVLDTVVVRVDEKHHPRLYDPGRVVAGTVTAAVTWGLFGLLTGGGVSGLVSSAVLGAVLGGLGGYLMEHVLSKASWPASAPGSLPHPRPSSSSLRRAPPPACWRRLPVRRRRSRARSPSPTT
jgi:hypothetical protein